MRDVVRCGGVGGGVALRGGEGGVDEEAPPTVSALFAKRRWRAPAPPFLFLLFSPDLLGRYFLEYV